ncbi:hypothetical protein JAAARDRAFT_39836 [Jaapia argillacea MUCL 33604]|uniref:MARVEL domain-containing protein n=1 Tax=Jaapia argillacea MUCL 33604 TaxID=933084 RepID=A0A067PDA1_9AGAM|nr:hypothetical protein JAAARDRAFT_39836 [Jaapia argillacea MUCL 33604]
MPGFSAVGRKVVASFGALLLVDIIVLALSAQVNQFQEYFFVADLFPLALSIITLVSLPLILLYDFAVLTSFAVRAPFKIGYLSVLSVLWLAFNAFSTARWSHVPLACDVIPAEYPDERTWCKNLQALKSFVWIEWLMFTATALLIIRYTISQHTHGNTHVWRVPFVRYDPRRPEHIGIIPEITITEDYFAAGGYRGSEFLQYEKQEI